MKKFLCTVWVVSFLLICGAAFGAQKYVVTGRLAPVFENAKNAKAAPKGGWVTVGEDANVACDAALAYGDVVEGTEAKNKKGGTSSPSWLSLAGDVKGFVELSLLTPMPKYTAFEPRPFQVLKDGVVPHLLPGKKPVSEYSKFTLPRGAVVTAEGRAEADGASWILCVFGTDYDSLDDAPEEDGELAGSDNRCAWLPEDALRDLAASKPNLSRVEEENLPGSVKGDARKYLLKNGFYVDPDPIVPVVLSLQEDDMVDLYKAMNEKTAKFITADLPFHALHLYFDRALQKVEEKALIQRTAELVMAMRDALKKQPKPASDLEKTARANVSNFLDLALHLVTNGGAKLPKEIQGFARGIMAGSGDGDNPFTEMRQDFSFFGPRGHYTLNDDMKAYFRATYLLGTGWPLDSETGAAATLILNKLLITPAVQKRWHALYDPITTLVGGANVNSPETFANVLRPFKLADLGRPDRVKALMDALDKAGKESVIQKLGGKKFAILPRRITFDALVFHMLTDAEYRPLPDPLDVMAVFGSKPAQDEVKRYAGIPGYEDTLKTLPELWPAYSESDDGANVYTSILSAMRTYFASKGSKQFFEGTPAWRYKKLTTAEGAMTELKHDTILYAEQSGAEMGEGADAWLAGPFKLPIPRSYVEPVPELFDALKGIARSLAKTLKPLLPDENEYAGEHYRTRLTEFAETMETLSGIARRARDDAMTYDDFTALLNFSLPSVLPENIFEVAVYDQKSQDMLKMALVADVATAYESGEVLYMATGAPRKLQVYVNDKSGGFRVTEGYMYSYYSFTQPTLEKRMNDDDWKAKVYGREDLTEFLPYWHEKLYQ